jgi:hypothetical protein
VLMPSATMPARRALTGRAKSECRSAARGPVEKLFPVPTGLVPDKPLVRTAVVDAAACMNAGRLIRMSDAAGASATRSAISTADRQLEYGRASSGARASDHQPAAARSGSGLRPFVKPR